MAWWGWNQSVATVAPIRSIAVLPLENLSGDPEQEYFADGMTEALITDLAKIGALKVISRTSVMRYKDSDKTLPEIARELGAVATSTASARNSRGVSPSVALTTWWSSSVRTASTVAAVSTSTPSS